MHFKNELVYTIKNMLQKKYYIIDSKELTSSEYEITLKNLKSGEIYFNKPYVLKTNADLINLCTDIEKAIGEEGFFTSYKKVLSEDLTQLSPNFTQVKDSTAFKTTS